MGAAGREALRARATAAVGRFMHQGLDLAPGHVAALLDPAFAGALLAFAHAARQFDPAIAADDIYQAGRNVATACCLQAMLGRPVALSESILGYSLLYPYTDNLLDDPRISPAEKATFNARFGRRLRGLSVDVTDPAEERIHALVARIEAQWPRAEFPAVYGSLLVIHEAQAQSVRLGAPGLAPYDANVLGLSIAKGGASVLADGYLVAGNLPEGAARALYGLGAYLQLVDDLQDLEKDRRAGQATLFTQTAGRWPLDGLTERALAFAAGVLQRIEPGGGALSGPWTELMARSAGLLLIEAAGRHPAYYSRRYLWRLQDHSPFRFGFLRRVRARLARRGQPLMALMETLIDPA